MAIMFNFMRDRTKWVHFGAITSITATHLNNSWEVCVTIEGCHDAIPYCQYVFLMRFVLNSGSYIFSRKVTKVQVWSVKWEERVVPPPQCAARGVHCPMDSVHPQCGLVSIHNVAWCPSGHLVVSNHPLLAMFRFRITTTNHWPCKIILMPYIVANITCILLARECNAGNSDSIS